MIRPLYIFDLDGTLALIEHRRYLVECPRDQQDWPEFYRRCDGDQPNLPVILTLQNLVAAGADIWIFSGRSDVVEALTMRWLTEHGILPYVSRVTMREEHDYTPDDQLKMRWLDGMTDEDRGRLVAVFDDRDKVVEMWRCAGVACFQVAPGRF